MTVTAGCGPQLLASYADHLPTGQSCGEHLAGTVQAAVHMLVPKPAVSFICHALAKGRYSKHTLPPSTLTYTGMPPDNSVVASYIPFIRAALVPEAPSMHTAIAGSRSFSAFAFISAISCSALALATAAVAVSRSACSLAVCSALALTSLASCSALALMSLASCSALALISFASSSALAFIATSSAAASSSPPLPLPPPPPATVTAASLSRSSAAAMSRMAVTPEVMPTEGRQPRSWRIFNNGSAATARACNKGLGKSCGLGLVMSQ